MYISISSPRRIVNTYVCNCDWLNDGRDQINEYNESHRETTETTESVKEDKFSKIVNSRVDPTTTLREQYAPGLGSDGVGDGRSEELRAERREVLQQERCQETIFTEREQVFLVQRVDVSFCIVIDDPV